MECHLRDLCAMLVATMVVLALMPSGTSAGCTQRRQCCSGKDISCRAKGPRMNSPSSRTCFCDEYCLNIGDCCRDYDKACQAQDCVLGNWGKYSDCDTKCGWGKKERKRQVIREPRFGGKACNITSEVKSCYGYNCKQTRQADYKKEMRETAKIIPAMYGSWRKDKLYDPYSDIRKNLFYHYRSNMINNKPSYCAHFEITRSTHSCHAGGSIDWARMLRRGTHVCVECQPYAMKSHLDQRCQGHGMFMQETRWTAFTVAGCHGKWRMKTHHGECTCDTKHDQSFIFV